MQNTDTIVITLKSDYQNSLDGWEKLLKVLAAFYHEENLFFSPSRPPLDVRG